MNTLKYAYSAICIGITQITKTVDEKTTRKVIITFELDSITKFFVAQIDLLSFAFSVVGLKRWIACRVGRITIYPDVVRK